MREIAHLFRVKSPELAKIGDLDLLMGLFARVRAGLRKAGLDQWPDWYPKREKVRSNIEAEELYILRNNTGLVATITLNHTQDPAYDSIQWSLETDNPWVVHRLVVEPTQWGQGIGMDLMLFAEDEVRKKGGGVIRLDTWVGNKASCALYERLGYSKAIGFCYFYGPDQPFLCLEKMIE